MQTSTTFVAAAAAMSIDQQDKKYSIISDLSSIQVNYHISKQLLKTLRGHFPLSRMDWRRPCDDRLQCIKSCRRHYHYIMLYVLRNGYL